MMASDSGPASRSMRTESGYWALPKEFGNCRGRSKSHRSPVGGRALKSSCHWRQHKEMRKHTVLLADDHAVVRKGLRFLLDQSGEAQVIGEASDGREAVALAQST